MVKKHFIVTCDTCADMPKSWYEKNDVPYIIMRRILGGKEINECFDKDSEFDAFYESIKKGDLPTTTQLNPFELKDFFEEIFKKYPDGDIIHVALSSGLSASYNNAVSASNEVNKTLGGKRKVHIVDSLMGTLGIGAQVEELARVRDEGMTTESALKHIANFRTHQQGWVIMSDLFHLKRGGRISAAKAAIGSVLNIRPIIHISAKGKLAIENKMKGNIKAVKYLVSRMEKYGEKHVGGDFSKSTVWVVRTSKSDLVDLTVASIRAVYPEVKIRHGIVGPIIGTHLGNGGVAVLWNGAPRLDID